MLKKTIIKIIFLTLLSLVFVNNLHANSSPQATSSINIPSFVNNLSQDNRYQSFSNIKTLVVNITVLSKSKTNVVEFKSIDRIFTGTFELSNNICRLIAKILSINDENDYDYLFNERLISAAA